MDISVPEAVFGAAATVVRKLVTAFGQKNTADTDTELVILSNFVAHKRDISTLF